MQTEVAEVDLYPETKTKTCQFCREQITLTRQGDGAKRMGLKNYWYVTAHDCAERRRFVNIVPEKMEKKKAVA